MNVVVAIGLGFVLSALAALHFYWAKGGLWPAATEQELVTRVIGRAGQKRMPGRNAALAVALALETGALIAWLLAFRIAPLVDGVVALGGMACALIFIGRGFAGYAPPWRKMLSAEPFATYDRFFYAPLCLVLGAGFAYLVWSKEAVQ